MVRTVLGVQPGQPLPDTPEHPPKSSRNTIATRLTFARITPRFDPASGVFTLAIDEGVIDGVEFQGVDDPSGASFTSRAARGDVF